MVESPSKRQRLSPTTYRATGIATQGGSNDLQKPATPTRRASYLSPTKASLARSHPEILAKSPKRGSLTEPRGKTLREELLGIRKSVETTSRSAPRPTQIAPDSKTYTRAGEGTGKDGFAEAIAQSFQRTAYTEPQGEDESRAAARSPLQIRQPPNTSARKRIRDDKIESTVLNSLPVPKLVKSQVAPARQPSESRNEPELPPTPIQLGIGMVPDRPRGLASSSSLGSKSGSGRHRRRVRESGGVAVTSSPLKPKNTRPLSPTDFSDFEGQENDVIEEAPESDVEGSEGQLGKTQQHLVDDQEQNGGVLSRDLQIRQTELASLRADLDKLRAALAKIESLTDQLQQGKDIEINESILEVLEIYHRDQNEGSQSFESHPSFVKSPSAYFDLFTPGNLQLKHETSTKQIKKRPKIVHEMTLAAPAHWPQDAMLVAFNVQIDAEDASIEQVKETQLSSFRHYGSLSRWVERRLGNRLHRYDVGGLVWGAGQYFEACTKRARTLRVVDEKYNKRSSGQLQSESNEGPEEALSLSPYLHRTQIQVANSDTETKEIHKSAGSLPKQIMLSYDIDLSWTGDATVKVEISLAGFNGKAQRGAKALFGRLAETEGVVGAFDAVWNLVGFGKDGQDVVPTRQQPARSRKGVGMH